MTQMQMLTATVSGLTQLPASDQYPWRFSLVSTSGSTYTVAQRSNGDWACSCPAHKFQKGTKRPCKHLRALGVN